MNDALKKVNQEGKRISTTGTCHGKRTVLQQVERWETEIRLSWKRFHVRRKAIAAAVRENTAGQASVALSAVGNVTRAPEGKPQPNKKHGTYAQIATMVGGLLEKARNTAERRATPDAGLSPAAAVWQYLCRKVSRAKRRWHHICREQNAQRFPESDRTLVQFLLMILGMLPMLGNRIRERTWGRRRQAINRFGHLRAWFEQKKAHPVTFLSVAGVTVFLVLFFSFYTFGTTVTYNGTTVAQVSSTIAAQDACKDLETVTQQTLGFTYTLDSSLIKYSNGLMTRGDVVSADDFEEKLSDDIGLVTYGYALYVDGELIGATPYQGALEELLQQLKTGVTDQNTISCDFQEKVEIKAEYVPTDKIMNLGYLAEMLYSTKKEEITYTVQAGDTWSEIANSHNMTSTELLAMNPGYDIAKLSIGEVLTLSAAVPYLTMTVTEREQYVDEVPYDIDYVDSSNLFQGEYKVLSAGKNGNADVMADVTYVNGEETQRTILSYVTLVNPVTEQQARGTKVRPSWAATGHFRWPCSGNVTSRFGYRNLSYSYASTYHEGIDIANRRGTSIYAADGGTVIYAGWMSGYGYLVQIDHGNGYVTYYGHNSSLLVSVGQHVYKGQLISKMGSTGNSTGNHCHFGIYYHGVAKNPLNYLS